MAEDHDSDMEDRFNEAHQGVLGLLFAAYKMHGKQFRAAEGSLPLTIIGGFLGSGKTTLLNHLLVSPHGRKIVVLVNDFGRINIDASLVASQSDDMITLSNGCACCAVAADLTNNLIEIAQREDLPDNIVLEASGIADPNGIASTALSNPSIRIDGNVVVVDAETMLDLSQDPLTRRLFHNQMSSADLIVLTKLDLVDDSKRTEARKWLATHYPDQRVIEAVNGDVPVELLLGIDTRREVLGKGSIPEDHVHDFESFSFTVDEPLDSQKLQAFIETLPEGLLRAKGVLNLTREPSRRTIYQRVGKRWSYSPAEPWGDEVPHSSVVFIGPTGLLNESSLEAGLDACRVESSLLRKE